jgi:AraC-like DNA-binding protein
MQNDLLTDLLRDAGLRRRLLDLHTLPPAVALQFPCERSMGLHLVVRGPVHVHAPGLAAPLALATGDVAVMARGCTHLLSVAPQIAGLPVRAITAHGGPTAGTSDPAEAAEAGRSAECGSAVISGAYQLWAAPLHPFFAEMPAWTVLRAAERPRLGPVALVTGLIEEELLGAAPGRQVVVHGLLDVVFAFALREVTAQCAVAHPGWSQAARDPQIRRVLALMHEDCAHPWTLEVLAQRAGLSRTGLAERFRQAMGDTPLNHLRAIRMQRAMHLLAETEHGLEDVAAEVGYQDAFGFSKVFKRTTGISPREFRQRDVAERSMPWRFQAG